MVFLSSPGRSGLMVWFSRSVGGRGGAGTLEQEVDLAPQAEAERGVEERGGEREAGRDGAEEVDTEEIAGKSHHREPEPDGLGEPRRGRVLELSGLAESGAQNSAED